MSGVQVSDTNPRTKKIKMPLCTHMLTGKKPVIFIVNKPSRARYVK